MKYVRRFRWWMWWLPLFLWGGGQVCGQTPEQVRLAFRNIRNDDIPGNAGAAGEWLFVHRNELTEQLLDELYRTDDQGRDVILYALLSTKKFQPDARFCRFLISRINEEEKKVRNRDLGMYPHWKAWIFIDAHYAFFRPFVRANLQTTDDMWCLWATLCVLQRRGEFPAMIPALSPHVWELIAKSMQADNIPFNAGEAVRCCLMIGQPALPHLREIAKSGDRQARDLAQATIDAMGGRHNAYGYLGSIVNVERDLFPGGPASPDWMGEEIWKWKSVPNSNYK